MRSLSSVIVVIILLAALPAVLRATDTATRAVVATYAGDGLIVRVLEWDEEKGTLRGEIVKDGATFPFTAKHAEDAVGTETVRGTFKAGDESFDFATKQEADSEVISLTSGGMTYRLRPTTPENAMAAGGNAPAPKPGDAGSKPAPVDGAKPPPVMRLKNAVFPDVTMGVPQAYVVTIPDDWSAEGQVVWQPIGEQPFPQTKFTITSPQGGRVKFMPNVTFAHSRAPGLGVQGEPAPDDFPQWLTQAVAKGGKVTNVTLVSSKRNEKAEQQIDEIDRKIGANTQGQQREVHVVTMEYDDEAGVRRREEGQMTYVRYQPFHGLNGFVAQNWAIFPTYSISAPADKLDQQRAQLHAVAGSARPTPLWFTQSQAVIAELSRKRAAAKWEEIIARGKEISRYNDEQYANYKKAHASGGGSGTASSSGGIGSDEAQRDRINSTYETTDYRDTNGQIVNASIHYKHVYSDGNNHFVLTNDSRDKPGSNWNELPPAK